MNKNHFINTALMLLEHELDNTVIRRFRNTHNCTITYSEAVDAIARNADRFSKEELLKLLLEDVSKEILELWAEGLRASNDIPAKSYGDFINVFEEEYHDIFDNDIITEKIIGYLKKKKSAVLSDIIKNTSELETIVLNRLARLIDDNIVEFDYSENRVFDTKIYKLKG